jgi:MFS transporter, DHA1 family, tetracycline resistance protein
MKKPSLLIIFLTVFIDLIGFGIVLPLLPRYAERFGAHGYQIGLIVGSFSLMQFFFAPRWGRLSDRIGRRPVLLISNAGSAISYALFGVASLFPGQTGLWLLVISRVFAGICGANLSVASAYIADLTSHENRSKGMGLIGMAFGFGFILGPALGALSAAQFGLAGPGWIAAGLCAFNFVLGCFILVESLKPGSVSAVVRPTREQWLHTLRQPKLGLLIGIFFLATFCFTCFETTLPLLLDHRFRLDEKHIGYLFAYCGVVAALIQGGAIGRLVKRFGEPQLIFLSLLTVAISLVMIPFSPHLTALMISLGVFAAGSGINRAPTMGLISIYSPAAEQGATLGVAQSAATLARIIGPVFATTLYAVRIPLPYVICAVIATVAGFVARHFLCKKPESLVSGDFQKAG